MVVVVAVFSLLPPQNSWQEISFQIKKKIEKIYWNKVLIYLFLINEWISIFHEFKNKS